MSTGQQQPAAAGTNLQGEALQQEQSTRRRWLPGLVIAGAVSLAALTGCASTIEGSAKVAPAAAGTEDGGGQQAPKTLGTGGEKTAGGLTVPTRPAPGGDDTEGGDTGGDGTKGGDTGGDNTQGGDTGGDDTEGESTEGGGVIPAPDIPTMKTIDPDDTGLGPVTLEPVPGGDDETTAAATTGAEDGGGIAPIPAQPTAAVGGLGTPGGKCDGLMDIMTEMSDLLMNKVSSGGVSQSDVDSIFTAERMGGLPEQIKPKVEKIKQLTESLVGKSPGELSQPLGELATAVQDMTSDMTTACI